MLIELLIFIAIGIAVAAPVGPIGMFCIRKTLERGFMGAVAVGMGAAIADGIYAFIGATGLVVISNFLLESHNEKIKPDHIAKMLNHPSGFIQGQALKHKNLSISW